MTREVKGPDLSLFHVPESKPRCIIRQRHSGKKKVKFKQAVEREKLKIFLEVLKGYYKLNKHLHLFRIMTTLIHRCSKIREKRIDCVLWYYLLLRKNRCKYMFKNRERRNSIIDSPVLSGITAF